MKYLSFFVMITSISFSQISITNQKLTFFLLEFTPCKAEQSLQGMQLQEKETQKDQGGMIQ